MALKFRLVAVGTHPLLMHNSRLCDPLDPIVLQMKDVTRKRTKTQNDHAELARLEWMGGVYFHEDVGVFVPGLNMHACLVEGAKLSRFGQHVKRGVFIDDICIPLIYEGPRDPETLCQDKNFVYRDSRKVQKNRVMRTRPIFRKWSLATTGIVDESVLSLVDLAEIANAAGSMTGLGDSRPAFGRFMVKVEEIAAEDGSGTAGKSEKAGVK